MIRKVLFLGAAVLLVGASAAYAFPPIDLTVLGAQVNSADGTIWQQIHNQPTGTGVYDPFLRFRATGTEQGMNTDGNANTTYDDVAGIWTHGIQLNQLATVSFTQGGPLYYVFSCDINEPNGGGQNLLSLDEMRLYTLGGNSSLTTEAAVTGAGGVLRYNLDATSDQTVYMDYNLNAGSGQDDIRVFIPVSMFAGASGTDFLYFYNKMGATAGMIADADFSSADGFEEWHALEGPQQQQLPEPSTVMILGTGLLGLAATRFRKK
jgi:PEP-CTERM motif-containing protein